MDSFSEAFFTFFPHFNFLNKNSVWIANTLGKSSRCIALQFRFIFSAFLFFGIYLFLNIRFGQSVLCEFCSHWRWMLTTCWLMRRRARKKITERFAPSMYAYYLFQSPHTHNICASGLRTHERNKCKRTHFKCKQYSHSAWALNNVERISAPQDSHWCEIWF